MKVLLEALEVDPLIVCKPTGTFYINPQNVHYEFEKKIIEIEMAIMENISDLTKASVIF